MNRIISSKLVAELVGSCTFGLAVHTTNSLRASVFGAAYGALSSLFSGNDNILSSAANVALDIGASTLLANQVSNWTAGSWMPFVLAPVIVAGHFFIKQKLSPPIPHVAQVAAQVDLAMTCEEDRFD